MKKITFTLHAQLQAAERKATLDEIKETIQTAQWEKAEQGRLTCTKTFVFRDEHYGRYYESKDVVPIFVDEVTEIVVITVYTFFSQKEVKS